MHGFIFKFTYFHIHVIIFPKKVQAINYKGLNKNYYPNINQHYHQETSRNLASQINPALK